MGSLPETYNDPTYLGILHLKYYLRLMVMPSKSFFLYLNSCIRAYIYSFMIGSERNASDYGNPGKQFCQF